MTVRRTALGEEEISDEILTVQKFEVEPAYVRVNAGVTKRIGEYESLRVDVSISVPCYKEEIEEIIPAVADIAADKLDDEVDKFMGTYDEED